MMKKISLGIIFLFPAIIIFILLQTSASNSLDNDSEYIIRDSEDIILENFNKGARISIVLPLEKRTEINFSKFFESSMSVDKQKKEIYFEKRGYAALIKTNKIKILYVTPNNIVEIYL